MELDDIKLRTTWNDAASGINSNFAKIRQAILSLLSGGEGLDESQLEEYLSSNGYAKEVWVLEKKYLDAVALGKYSSDFITVANGKITLKVDEQGGLGTTEQGLGIVDIPSHLLENITIEVDSELSDTSENAVQNKVITTELNKKTTLDKVKEYASDTYVSRASFGPTQGRKFVTGAVEESSAEHLDGKELVFNLDVRINDDIANAEEDIIDDNGVSLNNGIPTSNGVRQYVEDEVKNLEQYVEDALGNVSVDTSTLVTKEELADAEEVAAAALNDLEDRKADKEYVEDALKNMDTSSLASKEELEALRNEVITNEEIVASSLNDLKDRKADKEYVEDALGNLDIDIDTSTIVTKDEFSDVEEVWAASYNLLNQKISDIQQYIYDEAASRRQFDEAIAEIQSIIAENESVVTAAWNQLNTRINALEAAQAQGE